MLGITGLYEDMVAAPSMAGLRGGTAREGAVLRGHSDDCG